MVSFNTIPLNFLTSGVFVEVDNSRAVRGLTGQPYKALVVGHRLAAGTVAEEVATLVSNDSQPDEFFGRGSQLAAMLKAYKKIAPFTEVWAIAKDEEAGGTAATGTVTITGTATENGTLHLYIGGQYVPVGVTNGDTATVAGDAVDTAVAAAKHGDLPVTSSNTTGTVTCTCKWKGTTGNQIDLRINYQQGQKTPAGLTVVAGTMSSGATDPDTAEVIAAIGDEQYHGVVTAWPDATNVGLWESTLEARWDGTVMKEGHVFGALSDTHANMITAGNSRNSWTSSLGGAGLSPSTPWKYAAALGALDSFERDPARPMQTLELKGILAPAIADRFTRAERELLLAAGIATHYVDASGRVRLERLVTTYKTNAVGAPDSSYRDRTSPKTLSFLSFSVRTRMALRFPRSKLGNDGATGDNVVTPSKVVAELIALFDEWEAAGLVENPEQFIADLVVERDSGDPNRLNTRIPPDLINQLRSSAHQIQFLL
jgi:phage tail sheath gpL-like